MKDSFMTCLALTLREECGAEQPTPGKWVRGPFAYSHHPRDPGGETMMGILSVEYRKWRRSKGQPVRSVKEIEDGELNQIYLENYWVRVRGDDLPRGIDLAVFDMAVNCGVGTALRRLQSSIGGLKVDGRLGPKTLKALDQENPMALINKYSGARASYHKSLRTFPIFGRGWLARTERIRVAAVKMAGGAA